MSTSLLRLAKLGRDFSQRCFTNINQYLTEDLLRAAFYQTRKDDAVGVNGQTAADYATDLEGNLESLLERAKSGRYVAPPVKRGYVPKGDGKRPIGIRPLRTKCCSGLSSCYWSDCMNPCFTRTRLAIGPIEVRIRRWSYCAGNWIRAGAISSSWIFRGSSTIWLTPPAVISPAADR